MISDQMFVTPGNFDGDVNNYMHSSCPYPSFTETKNRAIWMLTFTELAAESQIIYCTLIRVSQYEENTKEKQIYIVKFNKARDKLISMKNEPFCSSTANRSYSTSRATVTKAVVLW